MKNYNKNGIAVIVMTVLASRVLEDLAEELHVKNIYPAFKPATGKAVAAYNFFNADAAARFAAAIETNETLSQLDASTPIASALAAGVRGAVSGKQAVFAHKCLLVAQAAYAAAEAAGIAAVERKIAAGTLTHEQVGAELPIFRATLAAKYGTDGSLDAAALIEKYKSQLPRA